MTQSVEECREGVRNALQRIPATVVALMSESEIVWNADRSNGFSIYAWRAAVREATQGEA